MGMTIDEYMAQLKKLKSFHNGSYGASINFALDIMRKYEKIEKIMAKRPKDMINSNPTLRAISEMLEDGNDDC